MIVKTFRQLPWLLYFKINFFFFCALHSTENPMYKNGWSHIMFMQVMLVIFISVLYFCSAGSTVHIFIFWNGHVCACNDLIAYTPNLVYFAGRIFCTLERNKC